MHSLPSIVLYHLEAGMEKSLLGDGDPKRGQQSPLPSGCILFKSHNKSDRKLAATYAMYCHRRTHISLIYYHFKTITAGNFVFVRHILDLLHCSFGLGRHWNAGPEHITSSLCTIVSPLTSCLYLHPCISSTCVYFDVCRYTVYYVLRWLNTLL